MNKENRKAKSKFTKPSKSTWQYEAVGVGLVVQKCPCLKRFETFISPEIEVGFQDIALRNVWEEGGWLGLCYCSKTSRNHAMKLMLVVNRLLSFLRLLSVSLIPATNFALIYIDLCHYGYTYFIECDHENILS